jgi:uncharacterized membrane protein
MKYLLIFIFYGLLYFAFEAVFNFITEDLFSEKLTWQEKLRFKVSNPPSLWMIPIGANCGLVLHFLFMLPLSMTNIFIFVLLSILGGIIITTHELASGLLLNVKFKLKLWDYNSRIKIFNKEIPLNFKRQIDLWHSLGWCGLTSLIYILDHLFKY